MSLSAIGSYDLGLAIFAALVALCSSYTLLELIDRVSITSGGRRFGWTLVGAIAGGLGAWSMGSIVTLSLRRHVYCQYDFRFVGVALVAGIGLLMLAIGWAAGTSFRFRRLICGGLLLGAGLVASNDLALQAAHGDLEPPYDIPLLLMSGMIAVSAAVLAMFVGVRLHARSPHMRFWQRLLAASLLSVGIVALYFMSLVAVTLRSARTPAPFAATNTPLAISLGLATFLILFGMLAASALDERARKLTMLYVRERNITTTLQQALLPMQLPGVAGVDFSNVYLPQSEESEVGGDWYDAFQLSDGRLAFSIGDVAGHGLSAALSMNVVRHALRAAAIEDATPANVLARANRILHASDYPAIVTATFGVLDPLTLQLNYAGAGHPPGIYATRDGLVGQLENSDPPLGVLDDLVVTEHHIVLPPGALLALYTDGVTEYDRDAIAGERRLRDAVRATCVSGAGNPAGALAKRIFSGHPRLDDAAILCLACAPTLPSFHIRGGGTTVSAVALANALRRFINGLAHSPERRMSMHRMIVDIIAKLDAALDNHGRIGLGLSASVDGDKGYIVVHDWSRSSALLLASEIEAAVAHAAFDEVTVDALDDVTSIQFVFAHKHHPTMRLRRG